MDVAYTVDLKFLGCFIFHYLLIKLPTNGLKLIMPQHLKGNFTVYIYSSFKNKKSDSSATDAN